MYDPEYNSSVVEQQHELLIQQRFGQPPSSVSHLADRVEASGAKIEETLNRLNCTQSTLYFVAGWIVLLAGVIGFTSSLMTLSLLGLIESMFLVVFGFLMMVLDVPGAPMWAARYRMLVAKQIRFLTRMTGKAVWDLYLGCMIMICLWPDQRKGNSGMSFLLGLLMSVFVIIVATIGLFVGVRKSIRLEKIRKQIISTHKGNAGEVYRKYAVMDPGFGIKADEFDRLCADNSQGRCRWDPSGLALIFNALDEKQRGAIDEREFIEWVAGRMTYL